MKVRESEAKASCVHYGGKDRCGSHPWDIDCSVEPSLTKQEFKDDCDVNVIIGRCLKSNLPLPADVIGPQYGDVSDVGSFQDCLMRIQSANDSFMQLDAKLRFKFGNDPAQLIAFLADPRNKAEGIELGLFKAEESKPVAAPAAPPTK